MSDPLDASATDLRSKRSKSEPASDRMRVVPVDHDHDHDHDHDRVPRCSTGCPEAGESGSDDAHLGQRHDELPAALEELLLSLEKLIEEMPG